MCETYTVRHVIPLVVLALQCHYIQIYQVECPIVVSPIYRRRLAQKTQVLIDLPRVPEKINHIGSIALSDYCNYNTNHD